ncbi:MAG: hypothetical protein ABIT81_07135 [Ferruginibacter sp.]
MKIFKWLVCLCLISTACKNERNFEFTKTEILNDQDLKSYVEIQVRLISGLNNKIKAKELSLAKDEVKTKETLNVDVDFQSSKKNTFYYYSKLYKKYVVSNLINREQLKSIITEAVTNDLSLRKNVAAN